MGRFRFVVVTLGLVILVAAGLAVVGQTARAQDVRVFERTGSDAPAVMAFRALGGGSRIGVTVRDADAADARRERTGGQGGAVVDEVTSGSPAEKAGFKSGDVVVAFDGERVRSARQFARLVEETAPGRTVAASVLRGGGTVELSVAPESGRDLAWAEHPRDLAIQKEVLEGLDVERLKRDAERAARDATRGLEGLPRRGDLPGFPEDFAFQWVMRPGRLGVGVLDLSPELARHLGADGGVLVNTVAADSAAAKAGIEVGDVIATIDGTAIEDSGDLRRRVWKSEEATQVVVGLVRKGQAMTVTVPLDPGTTTQRREGTRPRRPV
jgi:membrane-associated protease RseP (regulator of RpoE activity)